MFLRVPQFLLRHTASYLGSLVTGWIIHLYIGELLGKSFWPIKRWIKVFETHDHREINSWLVGNHIE